VLQKSEQEITRNWGIERSPKVSVCCVTYNHEKFISRALDGIFKQKTCFPFEVIVRDDCSTDASPQIILDYQRKYPNLLQPILEPENTFSKGIRPVPEAIRRANGNYIAFCDGDDFWRDEEKLQKQVDFLDQNQDFSVCYGNSTVIDSEEEKIADALFKKPRDYTQADLICGEAYIHFSTALIRNKIDLCPEKFQRIPAGDTSFWHLLGFIGKAKYLEEIEYGAYRVHDGGIWSGISLFQKTRNFVDTRALLLENVEGNPHYVDRIEKSISTFAGRSMYKSIRNNDMQSFRSIFKYGFQNPDVHFMPTLAKCVRLLAGDVTKPIKDYFRK
jgi:glycosyltransferase involved in cell wall biosynthesis